MRAVVQRVTHASVTADGEVTGAIGKGVVVLLGVTHGDTEVQAQWLPRKIAGLRIFEDTRASCPWDCSILNTPPGST